LCLHMSKCKKNNFHTDLKALKKQEKEFIK
jgi:hypothetical protein